MSRARIATKTINIKDEVKGKGQSNKCGRCTKAVYFAEETRAFGKLWHTNCFLCGNKTCNKRLDSTNATEHEGEIYCKVCYANAFGPKGYGFAGGAAGSMTLTAPTLPNIKPPKTQQIEASKSGQARIEVSPAPMSIGRYKQGSRSPASRGVTPIPSGKDICGRCNKKVYAAEKVWGPVKDQPWHQNCLTCKSCGKRLDSSTMKPFENEAYCVACYNKYHTPLAKR